MSYAQTNLQLYAQLRAEGYDEVDQRAAVNAYSLAVRLFAGLHRASGKTFLSFTLHIRMENSVTAGVA